VLNTALFFAVEVPEEKSTRGEVEPAVNSAMTIGIDFARHLRANQLEPGTFERDLDTDLLQ
jgi:hypothetical protein